LSPDRRNPPGEDLACQEVVEVVSSYVDGVMAPEQMRRFEAHLVDCPYCTEYVDQLREVSGALHGLGAESIAPERREALLEAFRGWHAG
jgi:anti-sigma factor RsiW